MQTATQNKIQQRVLNSLGNSVVTDLIDIRRLGTWLEKICFYGTTGLIILTAVPYGTVDLWSRSLFVFFVSIFAVLRILDRMLGGGSLISGFSLFSPLLGILLLALVQIMPIFGGTISYDPYETRNFILIYGGILLAGEILLHYTNSPQRLRMLVYLVIGVGTASAVFGLIRLAFPNSAGLGWLDQDNVQFAQFVNRNHFAFLIEMTVGLFIGIIVREDQRRDVRVFGALMATFLMMTVILTSSRGGITSLIGQLIFAGFLYFFTFRRKRFENITLISRGKLTTQTERSGWWIYLHQAGVGLLCAAALFVAAVFAVAFVGGDPVVTRIEKIQEEVSIEENKKIERIDIWRSTWRMIEDHPIAGIGFGAYAVAITAYDANAEETPLNQAHNDYLEILANGGVTAFLLTLAFVIILTKKIKRQIQNADAFRRSVCFGAVIGISGIFVHSLVDFGLHVVINALIFTVLIVIAVADLTPFAAPRRASAG